MEEEDLRNTVIIDMVSPIDLFRNPKLVNDIKRINQVLQLYTNVLYKMNQIQVMVPGYGKVWYDDKEIVNILYIDNLVKKYRVTYDYE